MVDKIDFAKLKAGVSIDSVLARYGIQTRKRNTSYLVANCPLPSHTSKDSPDSFAVNVEKNLWTCHSDSCKKTSGMKGGDVIDLVCLMEGTRLPLEGAKKLVEWFPQYGNGHKPPEAVSEINKPLAFTLKDVNPEHPMIQGRGITIETAKMFGVGFFPGKGSMATRLVFPLHENGVLIGYAGRATLPEQEPKWLLPKGLVKSFLYNLERCDPTKLLILTESLWAPLWFSQHGAQAASLMGSDLTEGQERCLEPFTTICIALDNDAKGKEATQKIAGRLRGKHKVLKAMLME